MGQTAKFRVDLYALLPLAGLCAMAVSHPLYDLLVREDHATFFVAHQSKAMDVYLLVFVLSAALPLALFLTLWVLNLLSKNLARAFYASVIFILFTALFMPVSRMLLGDLGWGNVGLGAGAAIACTFMFIAVSSASHFLGWSAVAALISPAMFLTNPAITSFLSTPEAQDYKIDLFGKNYPNIVMVVFDEMPLISLLDDDWQIDDVRFPNFARLAGTSTWYRNTVTAHTRTTKAVPALLTGRYVNHNQPVASAENFPESMVSFLRSSHQLRGVEVVTTFFDQAEDHTITPSFGVGFEKMAIDLAIVLGHVVLPPSLAGRLPPINSTWSDFSPAPPDPETSQWVRPRLFREFISLLRTTPRSVPAFFYLHILLPHSPLRFNDDGRSIGNELYGYGLGTRSATPNTFAKNRQDSLLIYQAHLLQTRFVDLILGELLDELESLGLFSDSLVVITSDHGIGYVWYEDDPPDLFAMRATEVYRVPLFLKTPGQDSGVINDEPMVTVDIFPTVAEILGKPIPWAVDGLSAVGSGPEREKRKGTGNPDRSSTWLPIGETNSKALETKVALFGQRNLEDLYFFGPHKDLLGRSADALPPNADFPSGGVVRLESDSSIETAGPSRLFYLKGELSSLSPTFQTENLELAIAINGVIRATTRTSIKKERITFATRIPPELWGEGEDSISVYAILADDDGRERSLVRFTDGGDP